MFDICEQEKVTAFGISAKFLSMAAQAGIKPAQTHQLDQLRMLLSTGSPLTTQSFSYVYEDIKPDCHLVSMSGGTDIVSCFMLGNPNMPVYAGELQCAGLGMAVEIWDENGHPLPSGKGELVCTQAFPACPIGFWDDPDQHAYKKAYFDVFPNVWVHGDYAARTEHDGYVIFGRSDATLNPGGVRIGTAEIYTQLADLTEIQDAVCVGQTWLDDTRVVLFVVLVDGQTLTPELSSRIKSHIRQNVSPRHVPAKIIAVEDIPRTLSGKIAEIAVRKTIHGEAITNVSALANPEALDFYVNLTELQT
jgi:acetoacetyl-CoA synthetase